MCDRLFKCFDFKIFFAQGCDNSDMCDDSDTCAESQLNHLVLRSYRTGLCDNSDMCGSEKIKAIMWGVWNAHPMCEDSDMCDSNEITPDIAALAADGIAATQAQHNEHT